MGSTLFRDPQALSSTLAALPIAHAPRVNSPDIPYIACDTKCSIYTSSHAIASSGEVKKLRISK